jgi:trans-aconitate methyltransferase
VAEIITQQHWDNVYTQKAETTVSWYQPVPEFSLRLIRDNCETSAAPVIDVGGGVSTLIDGLIAAGHSDVTVLDVSRAALERAQARLGPGAQKADWIVADMTAWTPARTWAIWHDRAVFHFLTERPAQDAYIAALKKALPPGGVAIIATFALDGPERCSNLAVQRYSSASLAERLGDDFALTATDKETHVTPWGATQNFAYSVFSRR